MNFERINTREPSAERARAPFRLPVKVPLAPDNQDCEACPEVLFEEMMPKVLIRAHDPM